MLPKTFVITFCLRNIIQESICKIIDRTNNRSNKQSIDCFDWMISFCKQQRSSADNFVVTQIVPPTSIRIYRYACCTGTWIILYCLYCTSHQSRKRTTVRNIVEKCTKLSETLIIAKSQHYRKKSGVIAKSQTPPQSIAKSQPPHRDPCWGTVVSGS